MTAVTHTHQTTSGTRTEILLVCNLLQAAYDQVRNSPSRGALTTDFLKGDSQPLQYLEGLNALVLRFARVSHGRLACNLCFTCNMAFLCPACV